MHFIYSFNLFEHQIYSFFVLDIHTEHDLLCMVSITQTIFTVICVFLLY